MFIAMPGSATHYWGKIRDGKIEEFAARHHTTVDDIRKASGPFFEGKDISTNEKFVKELWYKHNILVPVSRAATTYDWELWYFGPGTKMPSVNDVCEKANKDFRRVMVPPLTWESLLLDVANLQTLYNLFSRHCQVHSYLGAIEPVLSALAAQRPSEPVAILVPIPRVSSGIGVAVMPKGKGSEDEVSSSVVEAAPPWLVTFYTQHLRPLDEALDALVLANQTTNRIKNEAAAELAVFGALAEVARMMRDSYPEVLDPKAWEHRDVLARRMETFTRLAFDYMAGDIVETRELDKEGMRAKRAKDVLGRIQNAEAIRGVVQIFKGPDIALYVESKLRKRLKLTGNAAIGKVSLKGYLTLLVLVTIQETMHSPEYAKVVELLDRALPKIGAAKKSESAVQPDEEGWGDAILSVIGTPAGVLSSLVGDAPGPQALGMSFVAIAANYAPSMARLSSSPLVAWTGAKLTDWCGKIAGLDQKDLGYLHRIMGGDYLEKDTVPEGIPKAVERAFGKALRDKIEATMWQSEWWNASMSVLAAVSLLTAYEQLKSNPANAGGDAYVGVTGAAVGFIGAGLKTVVAFEKSYALAKTLSEAAGKVAAGLAVVVATWNLIRVYSGDATVREKHLALGAAASSWIVFIGFLCSSPGTQAIGVLLGLYVLVSGMDYDEKATFMSYLKGVGEKKQLADGSSQPSQLMELMALARNEQLATAYKDLVNYADYFHYFEEIDNSPSNRKRLAALGFTEQAIDGLTSGLAVADKPVAPVMTARRVH